jgi:hypothetical protein
MKARQLKIVEVKESAATITTEGPIVTIMAEASTIAMATSVELKGVFVRLPLFVFHFPEVPFLEYV